MTSTRQRIKRWHNLCEIKHTFSDAEYERRQGDLRSFMQQNGVDAILFTSIHNINYYSDFLYCSFGRPYGLAVTEKGFTTISAGIDAGQPARRTFGDNVVYTDWQRDNFFYAVRTLIANKGTLGIEFDHITVERLEKLKAALSDVKIVDISVGCMQMRMIKSQEEIELITQGAQVCDIGGAALVKAIKEKVPEYEVALASTQAMVREVGKRFEHAELMDTWTWFQSGINTDGAHNPVTTRKVQKGDILSLNCFAMNAGYYVALERTLFFDHCDDASLRYWQINVEVHERGLELIRPGAKCSEIASELNKIYEQYGLLDQRSFGYGHSFGVLSHYYGREALAELREDIDTEIKPNMVLSMEPMITIEEGKPGAGGYREHDILVVTEDGAKNITGFAYGPEHNIIPA